MILILNLLRLPLLHNIWSILENVPWAFKKNAYFGALGWNYAVCLAYSVFKYGLPPWYSSKESVCNAGDSGDVGLIPELRRFPRRGHGNPLQYSWLESPMDRGAWQTTVHRVAKSWTQLKQLSTHAPVQCLIPHFLYTWPIYCWKWDINPPFLLL